MKSIIKNSRLFNIGILYGSVRCICDLDVLDKLALAPKDEHRYYYNDFDGRNTTKVIADEYTINNHFIEAFHPKNKVVKARVEVLYCNPKSYKRRGGYAGRGNHYLQVDLVFELDNQINTVITCHQIKRAELNEAYSELSKYFIEYFGWDLLDTNKELNLKVFSNIYKLSSESKFNSITSYALNKSLGESNIAIEKACNKLVKAGFITEELKHFDTYNFKVYRPTQKGIERMNAVSK